MSLIGYRRDIPDQPYGEQIVYVSDKTPLPVVTNGGTAPSPRLSVMGVVGASLNTSGSHSVSGSYNLLLLNGSRTFGANRLGLYVIRAGSNNQLDVHPVTLVVRFSFYRKFSDPTSGISRSDWNALTREVSSTKTHSIFLPGFPSVGVDQYLHVEKDFDSADFAFAHRVGFDSLSVDLSVVQNPELVLTIYVYGA